MSEFDSDISDEPQGAWSTTDGIVVLKVVRPKDAVLTKTIGRDASGKWEMQGEYDRGYKFRAQEYPVSDILSLSDVIQRSADKPQTCVVRGGIRASMAGTAMARGGVRRLVDDRPDEASGTACFEERARRWIACDLDSFTLPHDVDPINDIEQVIDVALEQLPDEFRCASFFWQLTGGHGIKPGGRCRLWFWLSRHTTNKELKLWLADCRLDDSLFSAVQLTYTAPPVLSPGTRDLIRVRSGIRSGERDAVEVPAAEALQTVTVGRGERFESH